MPTNREIAEAAIKARTITPVSKMIEAVLRGKAARKLSKRDFDRRGILFPRGTVEFPESGFFIELDVGGKMFGPWIDENSRDNGYDYGSTAGHLVQNPAYVIESILRDVMNVPTDFIDYASFDIAGNTTNGKLNGWKFDFSLSEIINSRKFLEKACIQCKSVLYRNSSGQFSLIVYDSAVSVDYSDYKFDKTNNISNLQIYQTSYEDIASEIRINYWFDRGSQKFAKVAFIKAEKIFSGTYLNEAVDGTEYEWDVDDANVFVEDATPGAPGVALAGTGAGNLGDGDYYYKVTFVTAIGETEAGTASAKVTVIDHTVNGKVALSNIPIGNSSVTSRKIYRTEVGGGSIYKLLTTISDNTTTTYEDNIADGSLGATAPTANTTGQLYIMTDREINKIESVTGNTLTLVNAAGSRSVYYDSKLNIHSDNTPIYIVKSSSDAGDGATADTTRENEAIKAIWKYDAKNTIEIDADLIRDQTTAVNLRNYYHDWYSVPHYMIEFDTFLRASYLKIGAVIEFDDSVMDSYLKLGGSSWASKTFRVLGISRSGLMTFHIKAVEI